MKVTRISAVAVLAIVALIQSTEPASAQFGSLKKKAEDKAKQELEKKTEDTEESKPAEKSKPAKEQNETPAAEGETPAPTASAKPGEGVWLNYDFIPGDRVIFFDDFATEEVGNFPRRLEFTEGNMEVAEWDKARWLRVSTNGSFIIPLPEALPQRFTIEFDLYAPWHWNTIRITGAGPDFTAQGNEQTLILFSPWDQGAGLYQAFSNKKLALGQVADNVLEAVAHCRVMADGKYMKVYINETRTANVPNTAFERTNQLHFQIEAEEEKPAMFANFRIAAGDKKIYDALSTTGRVATHGILFDSGSDRIRPESTPTLKEIGKMLTDHADLKVLIEGHTDNVGDDASNMSLSERRAAAVASYLVADLGVDASRLQSKGFGETKPVTGNDTAEGRQNNRRVELVKL